MKLCGWLLILFSSAFIFAHPVQGQSGFPARGFSSILNDSQAEEKLHAFRQACFPDPKDQVYHQAYVYRFHFIHYPKTGKPIIDSGLLSGPSPDSPIFRIDLLAGPQNTEPNFSFLLLRNFENPKAWMVNNANQEVKTLSPMDWLQPWKEKVNHTPFDLLMPFITWPAEYEKSGRVCGRPAHLFVFTPPQGSPFTASSLHSVRLSIDDAYNAPLRIEHMDGGLLPARVFSLQSFKKIDERWLVKAIDAKDRDSGSRTRYELQAAAHGLDLPQSIFQPNGLEQAINLSPISFQSL